MKTHSCQFSIFFTEILQNCAKMPFLLYITLLVGLSTIFAENPRVKLPDEISVEGNELRLDNAPIVNEFLGIPFAEAPVGPLRFKSPEPLKSMGSNCSAFQAKKFAPSCLQSVGPIDPRLISNWWNPSIMVKLYAYKFKLIIATEIIMYILISTN